MKYFSTRGGVGATSYEETLFSGYAPDGGLYMPESIPKLDNKILDCWRKSNLSYPQVVEKIVRLFVPREEIPDEDLSSSITKAYEKFNVPAKIGFKQLNSSSGKPFILAELYHGRTGSFKDYAMSLVGQFLEFFSQKQKSRTVVLVGTSGDTGSAAMETIKGLKFVDIIVLYPKGKISAVQELQIISFVEDNIHVFAVEGTSDDLDLPIKACFPSPNVTSINSINWTRVMIQIAHYIYLYLREGEEIDIFVPTGGGGNIVAGIIARLMGIPINLYSATNVNDNVEMFVTAGIYRMGGFVIETPACAMDIRSPYNMERVLYLLSEDKATAKALFEKENGIISPDAKIKIAENIRGCFKTETSLIYETMKSCWEQNQYMICPHTATAVAYFNQHSNTDPKRKTYVIATASPFKFPESSEQAGVPCELWNGYQLRDSLINTPKITPQIMTRNEDWVQLLQLKIKELLTKSTS